MDLDIYPWDTKEKQRETKLYSFVDFPKNFLDIYKERRQRALESIKDIKPSLEQKFPQQFQSDKELAEFKNFQTSKIISTLYQTINNKKSFSKPQIKHFWKLLKKADLRKLRTGYDSNFINTTNQESNIESKSLLSFTLLKYTQSKEKGYLQALSTALKLNDFLISEKNSIVSSSEQEVILDSLKLEEQEINNLEERATTRYSYDIKSSKHYQKDPPIKIKNLGMLLQETNRSKAYLQKLINSGLYPNFVLLLKNPSLKENLDLNPKEIDIQYFNPQISEEKSLQEAKIPYQLIQAESCNDPQVVEILKQRPEDYFIFSGRGILKQALEVGKKLIHSHSGKLPDYKGSTCPYYSVLAGDGWHCTSFIMKQGIDEGEIITSREFVLPGKNTDATRIYDPYTRAEVMLETIKQLAETGTLKITKQDLSKGVTYYTIHPVLEFIAKNSF